MAAGDFNKGIVGDSERMLNAIADRARLVPWEMCVLLIDEIDTLAPNRDDPANAGNKGGDLLGVFLAILDGSKATPNLKIIASTNMKPKMDEAFLRRMEIQMFMGNPSSEARRQWITFKTKKCQGRPFYNEILNFVSDPVESDYFTTRTMNFSQDALRKVLERFLERSMRIEGQPSQYHGNQLTQKLREIADSSIQNVAEEMRVKIGGMTVCDILGKSR